MLVQLQMQCRCVRTRPHRCVQATAIHQSVCDQSLLVSVAVLRRSGAQFSKRDSIPSLSINLHLVWSVELSREGGTCGVTRTAARRSAQTAEVVLVVARACDSSETRETVCALSPLLHTALSARQTTHESRQRLTLRG